MIRTALRSVALATATIVAAVAIACGGSDTAQQQQEQSDRMTLREYARWCSKNPPAELSSRMTYGELTADSEALYLAYFDLTGNGRVPFRLLGYHLAKQAVEEATYRFSIRQNQDELVDIWLVLNELLRRDGDSPGDALEKLAPQTRTILEEEGCGQQLPIEQEESR